MKDILLIDDDKGTQLLVSRYLGNSGYKTFTANNGKEGIEVINREKEIGLIVVDVVMPVMDGVEFCRNVRAETAFNHIPILMLTAMSDISDKYIGFDAGADDYLTKPFEPLELLLRVQALLKRKAFYEQDKNENISSGKIVINNENFSVTISGREIYLTSIEFDMVCYLYSSQNKAISTEELLQKVMNYPPKTGNPETIRTHIKNIRAKIEEDSSNPKIITTVPKRGYMFNNI